MYKSLGETEKAIATYQQAARLKPDEFEPYSHLGNLPFSKATSAPELPIISKPWYLES
uniref:Tetratricopeptide repeat protein n=1 Tax=Desertifilum tharense IPPAS B-1220 TaxID=1781255 RepID=A0ACD5H2J5_9CYAN